MAQQHQVVIVGGGFGGLHAALRLGRAGLHVTLVDRRNFHLFQPLLYQVAMGELSPANIAAPLRSILKGERNVSVEMGEVVGFDIETRRVLLSDGSLPYDTLIVAAGFGHHYFGHDQWQALAPGLKTIEDATEIRRRVLLAFEQAEWEADPARAQALLTFVVVGGGPTGVELAGALREMANHSLRNDFRNIDSRLTRVYLVEGADRILTAYPSALTDKATDVLSRLGVTVLTDTVVTEIAPNRVTIRRKGEREGSIVASTVMWAAGVKASPLGETLAQATGAELDRTGRIVVQPDLTLPGHPEIFVIGDLAHCRRPDTEQPFPGIAPVAVQQGQYAAKVIRRRLAGHKIAPFRYFDLGSMATIGRFQAVAQMRGLHFSGVSAWLAWLFVHLMKLVYFRNRVLVLSQWAWNYITWNRAARLITGSPPLPINRP